MLVPEVLVAQLLMEQLLGQAGTVRQQQVDAQVDQAPDGHVDHGHELVGDARHGVQAVGRNDQDHHGDQ